MDSYGASPRLVASDFNKDKWTVTWHVIQGTGRVLCEALIPRSNMGQARDIPSPCAMVIISLRERW